METYRTTTYRLTPEDKPLVVTHDNSVSLHHQAWTEMPHGFSIFFMPEHLPILYKLCHELVTIRDQGCEGCLILDLEPEELSAQGTTKETTP